MKRTRSRLTEILEGFLDEPNRFLGERAGMDEEPAFDSSMQITHCADGRNLTMPRRFKRWHFTSHVMDRMWERGISDQKIKETVLHPDRAIQQGKGIRRGEKWIFKKTFVGHGLLEVVAEFSQDTCYLATAYWRK
jgi:hypothetical protein